MSDYYEQLGDYLASDTAHQGPCLTDADLAEEEADSEDAGSSTCGQRLGSESSPPSSIKSSVSEIGLTDALGHDALQDIWEMQQIRSKAGNLVSLHYGHGGLAGRKRAEA